MPDISESAFSCISGQQKTRFRLLGYIKAPLIHGPHVSAPDAQRRFKVVENPSGKIPLDPPL